MNDGAGLILCRAKLLGARVTGCNYRYWASLWVDGRILETLGVHDYEKVLVVNIDNGQRFETYVRSAPPDSGEVKLAGGGAHLGKPGDEIGFLAFAVVDSAATRGWKPTVVVLGEGNRVKSISSGDPEGIDP